VRVCFGWAGARLAVRARRMRSWTDIPAEVLAIVRRGAVLPAHPLAHGVEPQFDREAQRALARCDIAAGGGGLAVGVHATQ